MKTILSALLIFCAGCVSSTKSVREPASTANPWQAPLTGITLEAPIEDLFRAQRAEKMPATVSVNKKGEKGVKGHLTFASEDRKYSIEVLISVRGQTSRDDCPFPKLKLKWEEEAVAGTPLEGLKGWRLNTHCGEPDPKQEFTEMGRVKGDRGPTREMFAYQVQELAGIPSLNHRLEKIQYKDISKTKINVSGTHMALILEHKKDAGARLGGELLEEEDLQTDGAKVAPRFDEYFQKEREAMLHIAMFQTFILNFDFGLPLRDILDETHYNRALPPGFRNMYYLKSEANSGKIIPTDYDVSTLVLQNSTKLQDPEDSRYFKCDREVCQLYFVALQKWRSFFTKKEWAKEIPFWIGKKDQINSLISSSKILTAAEKKYLVGMTVAFYQQLDYMFQVPVIIASDAQVIADEKEDVACGQDDPSERVDMFLPRGTPAFNLATGAKHFQVKIFDVRDGSMVNPLTGSDCLGLSGIIYIRKRPVTSLFTSEWPNR